MEAFEDMIEVALQPGRFFHWRVGSRLVRELEAILAEIEQLENSGERQQALSLYETFIASCQSKAGEIDDSSGIFGEFFDELIAHWTKAAETLGMTGAEIASKVSDWAENDDYGYLDRAVDVAARVVSKETLAGFTPVLRVVWENAVRTSAGRDELPDFRARIAAGRLKFVLWNLGDFDGYLAFCDETELSSRDCLRLAGIRSDQGILEQALEWTEKGLLLTIGWPHLRAEQSELEDAKLRLLKGLGKADDAKAFAWKRFDDHPSRSAYLELMDVCPDDQRDSWHQRALSIAERQVVAFMHICVATQSWSSLREALAKRADKDLMSISYVSLQTLARDTVADLPDVAARLYSILAHQILNEARAKAYHYACDYLSAARRCYQAAGMAPAWDELVELLQKKHSRKYRFVERFKQVLDGTWGGREPLFLEKAKSEWPK